MTATVTFHLRATASPPSCRSCRVGLFCCCLVGAPQVSRCFSLSVTRILSRAAFSQTVIARVSPTAQGAYICSRHAFTSSRVSILSSFRTANSDSKTSALLRAAPHHFAASPDGQLGGSSPRDPPGRLLMALFRVRSLSIEQLDITRVSKVRTRPTPSPLATPFAAEESSLILALVSRPKHARTVLMCKRCSATAATQHSAVPDEVAITDCRLENLPVCLAAVGVSDQLDTTTQFRHWHPHKKSIGSALHRHIVLTVSTACTTAPLPRTSGRETHQAVSVQALFPGELCVQARQALVRRLHQ